MKIIIGMILLVFTITSCTSSPRGKSKIFDGVEYLFIEGFGVLNVYAISQKTVPIKDKILTIGNLSAEMTGKQDTLQVKKKEEMESIFEGSYPISEKEKVCISVFKTVFRDKNIEDIKVKFLGKSNYGIIKNEMPKKFQNFMNIADNNLFLRLIPMVEESAPNKLNFKMLVIRIAPFQGSYMPSSENFRVIIHNKNDQKWNSSEGKMYMQVVGVVPPSDAGDYEILEMEYPVDQKFEISGQNKMEFIVPALPRPSQITFNYWKQ